MTVRESLRKAGSAGARPEADTTRCDVCGGPAYDARCKIICRRCGYTRDCSDP